MKILIIFFCLSINCTIVHSQTDPCPGGTTYFFNELKPTIDIDKKRLTYTSFDCMSCQFADFGDNCRCRKACHNNEECLKKCGEFVPPNKVIRGFGFKIEVWLSNDIVTSLPMIPPNEMSESGPNQVEKLPPCYVYNFSQKWDGFNSVCIKTNFVVSYDDGTCCVYQDRICKEIN